MILAYIEKMQKQTCFAIGYRPMTAMVNKEFKSNYNKKRIRRIMVDNNLSSIVRPRKYTAEQYKRRRQLKLDKPKDLLNRNFFSGTPRKVYVEDITYLYCFERMHYLNTIMDLFNKEIVSWKISTSPNSILCTETVRELSLKYDLTGCIIHTDGGTSYLNKMYMELMNEVGAIASVSIGCCYDNASEESFNSILKTEGLYNWFGKTKFKDRRIRENEVLQKVVEFIYRYNHKRRKKEFNWRTPVEHYERNPKGTLPIVYKNQLTLPEVVVE